MGDPEEKPPDHLPELGLSHKWPKQGSTPQRWDDEQFWALKISGHNHLATGAALRCFTSSLVPWGYHCGTTGGVTIVAQLDSVMCDWLYQMVQLAYLIKQKLLSMFKDTGNHQPSPQYKSIPTQSTLGADFPHLMTQETSLVLGFELESAA